jgi:hypothetical protein
MAKYSLDSRDVIPGLMAKPMSEVPRGMSDCLNTVFAQTDELD